MRFACLISAMCLTACSAADVPAPKAEAAPSLTLEDIDFNGYSKELAKFTGLAEGQSRGEAIDNIRLYFAPDEGNTIIQTSQSAFEREDGAVLLFSPRGCLTILSRLKKFTSSCKGQKATRIWPLLGLKLNATEAII